MSTLFIGKIVFFFIIKLRITIVKKKEFKTLQKR